MSFAAGHLADLERRQAVAEHAMQVLEAELDLLATADEPYTSPATTAAQPPKQRHRRNRRAVPERTCKPHSRQPAAKKPKSPQPGGGRPVAVQATNDTSIWSKRSAVEVTGLDNALPCNIPC